METVKQTESGDGVDNLGVMKELLQTPHNDALVLSEAERLILDLVDQQEELLLERSLFEAVASEQPQDLSSISDDALQEQLITAEREAQEARATYMLRNKIVRNVLITDPVLKAVHGGLSAAPATRRLLPLVSERDVLSMAHSTLITKLSSVTLALSRAEQDNVVANERNKELAQILLALADQLKAQKTEEIEDPNLRSQMLQLEDQVRRSRRRWRIMKNMITGAVVGSGVDWARDQALQDLVLDDEDELD